MSDLRMNANVWAEPDVYDVVVPQANAPRQLEIPPTPSSRLEAGRYLPPTTRDATTLSLEDLRLFGAMESARARMSPPIAPRTDFGTAYMFKVMQRWLGVVDCVEGDQVQATLVDLDNPAADPLNASISMDNVVDGDRALVEPGAEFYLTVGQERFKLNGQVRNEARVRFRRMVWSRREVAAIRDRAQALSKHFEPAEDNPELDLR